MELFRELNKNLKVDFKRAISSPKVLIFIGISLIMPILIIVMTSMNASDGNGAFTNAWQILGSINQSSAMSMDLTSMCNINLVFILALVFSNLFIGEDFTSGFYKNIFSIRTSKITYCLSKIIVTTFFSMLMFISFFCRWFNSI